MVCRACATVTVYSERDEAVGRDAATERQSDMLLSRWKRFPAQFAQWTQGPDGRSV